MYAYFSKSNKQDQAKMNPTHYNLPHAKLGILDKKSHTMTIPTLAKSSSLTNNRYKDLHYIIDTLKGEPDVEDITKPNLT